MDYFPAESADDPVLAFFDGGAVTFRELDAGAHALAVKLRTEFGLARGDRVVLCSELRLEGFEVMVACHLLGAVYCPIHPQFSQAQVSRMVAKVEPRVCIVTGAKAELFRAAAQPPVLALSEGRTDWGSSRLEAAEPPGAGETAMIVQSSGTTGEPKAVELQCLLPEKASPLPGPALLHAPFSGPANAMSFWQGVRTGWLMAVATAALDDEAAIAQVAQLIQLHGIKYLPLLPITCAGLSSLSDCDFPSVIVCTLGSAMLSVPRLERLERLLPNATFLNTYGQTENPFGTFLVVRSPGKPLDMAKLHGGACVGKPMPGSEVRIDGAKEAGQGAGQGEVLLRIADPSRRALGYWGMPQETAATFTQDGWVRTGDLGFLDAAGDLVLCGRLKDTIKLATGMQLFSKDIEAALLSHSSVADAAVLPLQVGNGEVPFAFVVASQPLDHERLREYLGGQLSTFQMPKWIEVVNRLPITPSSGKIAKAALHELATVVMQGAKPS